MANTVPDASGVIHFLPTKAGNEPERPCRNGSGFRGTGRFLGAVIDGHIADPRNKLRAGTLRNLDGKRLLLILEISEPDFDQAVMVEGLGKALEKSWGDAGVADFEDRLKKLGA